MVKELLIQNYTLLPEKNNPAFYRAIKAFKTHFRKTKNRPDLMSERFEKLRFWTHGELNSALIHAMDAFYR